MHKIFLTTTLLCFCALAFAQTPYYTVKFPDDRTFYNCGLVNDNTQPIITNQANCGFNVGIAFHDQVFYTGGGTTCAKTLRTWTLIWWCDYNPNTYTPYYVMNPTGSDTGPTFQANSSNHGYLKYTQIIKTLDNVPPVVLGCPAGTVLFCDYTTNNPGQYNNNYVDRCEGPVDLKVRATDACAKSNITLAYRLFLDMDGNGTQERLVSSSDANAWPIDRTTQADTAMGKIIFPNNYGLPYGIHKIEWIIGDNCAGTTLCVYQFEVRDCKAPGITCNSLNVNIMQTGMITLFTNQFLQYVEDNCTASNLIKTGIRKPGTGTGFPVNSPSVTFTCSELGLQPVQIWAQDASGNADFCLAYINVQDNIGACPSVPNSVNGSVASRQAKGIKTAKIALVNGLQTMEQPTDSMGRFVFNNVPACGVTVTPAFNKWPTMGVTVADAIQVAMHAYNMTPITDKYAQLAADVDRDKQITISDMELIFAVALGADSAFKVTNTWCFVPKTTVFPDSTLALNVPFEERIQMALPSCIQGTADFIAVKMGDVDDSASGEMSTQARAIEEDFAFRIKGIQYRVGQEIRIPVQTPDLLDVAGFQMGLTYDPISLELAGVESGLLNTDQTVHFKDQNLITAAWFNLNQMSDATAAKGRQTAFTLVFKAKNNGSTLRSINLNDSKIISTLYDKSLSSVPTALIFEEQSLKTGAGAPRLLPVQPNPAQGQMAVKFELTEAGSVTVSLTSTFGRTILQQFTGYYEEGQHTQLFDLSSIPGSGLYFVRIENAKGVSIQQVAVKKD